MFFPRLQSHLDDTGRVRGYNVGPGALFARTRPGRAGIDFASTGCTTRSASRSVSCVKGTSRETRGQRGKREARRQKRTPIIRRSTFVRRRCVGFVPSRRRRCAPASRRTTTPNAAKSPRRWWWFHARVLCTISSLPLRRFSNPENSEKNSGENGARVLSPRCTFARGIPERRSNFTANIPHTPSNAPSLSLFLPFLARPLPPFPSRRGILKISPRRAFW